VTYKGIVKGKTIECEDPLALPDGTEVDVVHVRPGTALAFSDLKGSGQALLRLWDTPAQCTPEDVATLLQAIDQGRRPAGGRGDVPLWTGGVSGGPRSCCRPVCRDQMGNRAAGAPAR
jgi:hypothetical protein